MPVEVAAEVVVALRIHILAAASQTLTVPASLQRWILDSQLSVKIASVWRDAGLMSLALVGTSVAAPVCQAALIAKLSNALMVALQTRTAPDLMRSAILL